MSQDDLSPLRPWKLAHISREQVHGNILIPHEHIWPLQVISQSWVSEGAPEGLGTTFFLDGAHTPESMATCADWFAEASQLQQESSRPAGQPPIPPHRILLFNCMKVALQAHLIRLVMSEMACCIRPGLPFEQWQLLKCPAYC